MCNVSAVEIGYSVKKVHNMSYKVWKSLELNNYWISKYSLKVQYVRLLV